VGTPQLLDLLSQEAGSFQRLDSKWRPKDLFFELQTQELLKDMFRRYAALKAAEDELRTLDRSELFFKYLHQMEFILRRAKFVRRFNHLAFGQAVAEFYTAFGQVLRYLKINQARGRLQPV
jgi:hypothetical protein